LISKLLLILSLFIWDSPGGVGIQATIENTEVHVKETSDTVRVNNVLYTGWYFISDTPTGYKRQLLKTSDSYDIQPLPIITTTNMSEVSLFHEKDCWALFTWLDRKGSEALNAAIQKANGKNLAFILDNKLLRLQVINDPQFAKVTEDVDPRVYGEVLTFPCNSFLSTELQDFQRNLQNAIKGNR